MSILERSAVAILVVEDEALIRWTIAEHLRGEGLIVHEARNADEAIAAIEAHPDIRIVFTDVHMPGSMDGLKLAHYARDRWPPIKLIVTSGKMAASAADLPGGATFFEKPYRPDAIAKTCRELANVSSEP